MSELYNTGRQLGLLLRGLVSGLSEEGPPPAAPATLAATGAARAAAASLTGAPAAAPSLRGAVEAPDAIIRPAVFALLLALSKADQTTGSVLQQAATLEAQGHVAPGSGTTQRALQRLRAAGLVEQLGAGAFPQAGEEGRQMGDVSDLAVERRQSFRLTAAGHQALQEQASLIIALAEAAQRTGLRRLAARGVSPKTKAIPEEFTGVLPHLIVSDAAAAAAFYKEAFDADELWRDVGPDGRIWHLEILIRGTRFPIADEFAGMRLTAPSREANSVVIHQYVYDVDEAYKKAVAAGAQGLLPPNDTHWGDRYSQVQDPFGHRWALASRIEDLSPAQQRMGARAFREQNPDLALEPPM